ncbi:MAG TPA: hypothetical protein V6D30_15175 [Leptolyngbyaceae cyanobacterium]
MTYADEEFIPAEGQEESANYPRAFGITFTPRILGVIIALAGLGLATYLMLNFVLPQWEQHQKLQGEIATAKGQIKGKEKIKKEIEQTKVELDQAKQQNKQVLNLFANDKTLETLLLDLNSSVKSRNGTLLNFTPDKEGEVVVNDGSLGSEVNGKLKRTRINLELEGSFDEVQSILRSFERLQSLLLVKDFRADISEPQALKVIGNGRVVPLIIDKNKREFIGAKPTIETKFTLEALSPVTEEDTNKATTDAKPAKKAK